MTIDVQGVVDLMKILGPIGFLVLVMLMQYEISFRPRRKKKDDQ